MIVLDEHLQSKGLDISIRRWYTGSVVDILDLRPGTIIKDDAIPGLLAAQTQPVFVTINVVSDFWLTLPVSDKYCIVCFALTTSEIVQIPELLRRLLRHAAFDTKAKRAGTIVRITLETAPSARWTVFRSPHAETNRPVEPRYRPMLKSAKRRTARTRLPLTVCKWRE